MRILEADLAHLGLGLHGIQTDKVQETILKLAMHDNVHTYLEWRLKSPGYPLSFTAGRYHQLVAIHMEGLRITESYNVSLPTLIRVSDIYAQLVSEESKAIKKHTGALERKPPRNLPLGEEQHFRAATQYADTTRSALTARASLTKESVYLLKRTIERMNQGQLQDVLEQLPSVQHKEVLLNLADAIASNASSLSERIDNPLRLPPQAIAQLLTLTYPPDHLPPPSVVTKPGFNLHPQAKAMPYAELVQCIQHFPHVAVEKLLEIYADHVDTETFLSALLNVDHAVKQVPDAKTAWVITLMELGSRQQVIATLLPSTVVPARIRGILVDEAGGRVWLTPDDKLVRTGPSETHGSGIIILEIGPRLQAETAPPEPIVVFESTPPQPKPLALSEVEIREIPLVGQVGLPNQDTTLAVIERLTDPTLSGDQELDRLMQLVEAWKKTPDRFSRNFLYLPEYNHDDPILQHAAQRGIAAVYVHGNEFTFVLDSNIATATHNGSSLPAAIHATLGNDGMLSVDCTDDSFTLTPPQLWLSNLALHCASQSVYAPGSSDVTDQQLGGEVNGWAGRINHDRPNAKVGRNGRGVGIPVTLDAKRHLKTPVILLRQDL